MGFKVYRKNPKIIIFSLIMIQKCLSLKKKNGLNFNLAHNQTKIEILFKTNAFQKSYLNLKQNKFYLQKNKTQWKPKKISKQVEKILP
jgi:hypothetical protein